MRTYNKIEDAPKYKKYVKINGNKIKETEKAILFSFNGIEKYLPKSKIVYIYGSDYYYIEKWVLTAI